MDLANLTHSCVCVQNEYTSEIFWFLDMSCRGSVIQLRRAQEIPAKVRVTEAVCINQMSLYWL